MKDQIGPGFLGLFANRPSSQTTISNRRAKEFHDATCNQHEPEHHVKNPCTVSREQATHESRLAVFHEPIPIKKCAYCAKSSRQSKENNRHIHQSAPIQWQVDDI